MAKKAEKMVELETGATRSSSDDKPDYRGFVSPRALQAFGRYMMRHQTQADGKKRASDNWKKGMPLERYVESKVRHDIAFWDLWERYCNALDGKTQEDTAFLSEQLEEEICACFFNVQGFLHEWERLK